MFSFMATPTLELLVPCSLIALCATPTNIGQYQLLNLGHLDIDTALILAGANIFPAQLPPKEHERRTLIMIAGLLHYPDIGLIIFDAGSCEDAITTWEKEVHGLPEATKATGAGDISDVKVVIMSHLHQDHAGGLEHFIDSDVAIWCHEEEFKHAFWGTATGIEKGNYQADYLSVNRFNWKTFAGDLHEPWAGITSHRCPGHTPGSIILALDLQETGSVILRGDAFYVSENYELGIPPGTITRDFTAWHRSRAYILNLAHRSNAEVVLGHETTYSTPSTPIRHAFSK